MSVPQESHPTVSGGGTLGAAGDFASVEPVRSRASTASLSIQRILLAAAMQNAPAQASALGTAKTWPTFPHVVRDIIIAGVRLVGHLLGSQCQVCLNQNYDSIHLQLLLPAFKV